MKRIIFALKVIFFISLFQSCQKETLPEEELIEQNLKIEIDKSESSNEPIELDSITASKIKTFNKKNVIKFAEKYGDPDLLHTYRLIQPNEAILNILLLKNKNNLLVYWEDSGSQHYRIINRNKKLSSKTTKNTPIPANIFNIIGNTGQEPSNVQALILAENCVEVILQTTCTSPDRHWPGDPECECQVRVMTCQRATEQSFIVCEENDGGGTTGDTTPAPPTDGNGGGETEDPFCDIEEPICSTCLSLYAIDGDDPNCPEPSSAYEECLNNGGSSWSCCSLSSNGCTLEDNEKKLIASTLGLSTAEVNYFYNSEYYAIVQNFRSHYNYADKANASATAFIKLSFNNRLYAGYSNSSQTSSLISNSFTCCQLPLPTYGIHSSVEILQEYVILKKVWEVTHPNEQPSRALQANWMLSAIYNYSIDSVHTALDLCGIAIDVCDPINGIIYLIEGDGLNAALSFMATVPVVGSLALTGKWAGKSFKYGGKAYDLIYNTTDGINYTFGSYGKLKSILRAAVGEQTHHIIPWALNNLNIIQKAAKSGWHPSDPNFNGINLSTSIHSGYTTAHRVYSERLTAFLQEIDDVAMEPEIAERILNNLQEKIKQQLMNGKKLDEVVFN